MNRLRAMLHDEKKAPGDYYKLMKQVKGRGNKRIIRGIIRQERLHFAKLTRMKRRLR